MCTVFAVVVIVILLLMVVMVILRCCVTCLVMTTMMINMDRSAARSILLSQLCQCCVHYVKIVCKPATSTHTSIHRATYCNRINSCKTISRNAQYLTIGCAFAMYIWYQTFSSHHCLFLSLLHGFPTWVLVPRGVQSTISIGP